MCDLLVYRYRTNGLKSPWGCTWCDDVNAGVEPLRLAVCAVQSHVAFELGKYSAVIRDIPGIWDIPVGLLLVGNLQRDSALQTSPNEISYVCPCDRPLEPCYSRMQVHLCGCAFPTRACV